RATDQWRKTSLRIDPSGPVSQHELDAIGEIVTTLAQELSLRQQLDHALPFPAVKIVNRDRRRRDVVQALLLEELAKRFEDADEYSDLPIEHQTTFGLASSEVVILAVR